MRVLPETICLALGLNQAAILCKLTKSSIAMGYKIFNGNGIAAIICWDDV